MSSVLACGLLLHWYFPIIYNVYWTYLCVLSHIWLFVVPGTVARQTPLSMGFSRQEYWSELPLPAPGSLPDPGIESTSPALAGRFFPRLLLFSKHVVCSVMSPWGLFVTPWTAAHQVSLSFTISWSLLKLMSIESKLHLGSSKLNLPTSCI